MIKKTEAQERADDDLPMWVVRDETPQELIDQSWNPGRENKYFKPPTNDQESATYYDRYAAWQAKWRDTEQNSESILDIPSTLANLQTQIAILQRQVRTSNTQYDPADNWPPGGDM